MPPYTHMTEGQWKKLISEIKQGNCTPFLGAAACYGLFQKGYEIAEEWAIECEYPIKKESSDLAKVAQYYSLHIGMEKYPHQLMKEKLEKQKQNATPDVLNKLPHNFLARLPISIYMTTNYDNEMYLALKKVHESPTYKICDLNKSPKNNSKLEFVPSLESPLVYHLHGHIDNINSLVLTENDYLDFLSKITTKSLPAPIHGALTKNTLLFIGYSLSDVTFRTLYRGIINQFKLNNQFKLPDQFNVAIQIVDDKTEEQRRFLETTFRSFNNIQIFWGTAERFIDELQERLK
jgi:hypothetical protein